MEVNAPAPPDLLPGQSPWYEAFFELSTDRQIGMAIGPLPAASVDRHTAGWPDEDADAFRVVMRAMDRVYLEISNRKPEEAPDMRFAGAENPAEAAFSAAFVRG